MADDFLQSALDAAPPEVQADANAMPLATETPTAAADRVATGQRQTALYGRMKAADLATRGIPSYSTPDGQTKEITDGSGQSLTSMDPKNGIAYDSAGNPVSYKGRDDSGNPVLTDPYQEAPRVTDKQGNIMSAPKGLGWRYEGQDPEVAADYQAAQDEKMNQMTASAIAPYEAQAKTAANVAAKAVKASSKQTAAALAQNGVPLTDETGQPAFDLNDVDGPTLKAHIDSTFNKQYASPEANASPWFGGGQYSSDAQALRQDIDNRKAAANAAVDAHLSTLTAAQTARAAADDLTNQRQALQASKLDYVNGLRAKAGLPPIELPALSQASSQSGIQVSPEQSIGDTAGTQSGNGNASSSTQESYIPGIGADGSATSAAAANAKESAIPGLSHEGEALAQGVSGSTGAQPSLYDRAKNFIGSTAGGFVAGLGSMVKGVGELVSKTTDEDSLTSLLKPMGFLSAPQTLLKAIGFDSGKAIQSAGAALQNVPGLITNPAFKDDGEAKVGRFIGGVGSFLAGGEIGAAAKVGRAATLIPLLFSSGYADQHDAAQAHFDAAAKAGQPVNPEDAEEIAHRAGLLGGSINAVLGVPLEGAGKSIAAMFGKATPEVVKDAFLNAYNESGSQGVAYLLRAWQSAVGALGVPSTQTLTKEAVLKGLSGVIDEVNQTAGQRALGVAGRVARDTAIGGGAQVGQNLVTQTYDKDRGTFEGAVGQALGFGIMGGLFGGLDAARAHAKAATEGPILAKSMGMGGEGGDASGNAGGSPNGPSGLGGGGGGAEPAPEVNTGQKALTQGSEADIVSSNAKKLSSMGYSSDEIANMGDAEADRRVRQDIAKPTDIAPAEAAREKDELTQTQAQKLADLGYSDAEVAKMGTNEAQRRIEKEISKPAGAPEPVTTMAGDPVTESGPLSDLGKSRLSALGFTDAQISEMPTEKARRLAFPIDKPFKATKFAEPQGSQETPGVAPEAKPLATTEPVKTIDDAAHEAATSPFSPKAAPTPAQIGKNAPVGRFSVGGLPVSIEHPAGTSRKKGWKPLTAHYGYFRGGLAASGDGEKMDAFVKTGTPEDYKGPVFVVNRHTTPEGNIDHKIFLGASTREEAAKIHNENYPEGLHVKPADIAEYSSPEAFKAWAQSADQHKEPAPGDTPITKETNEPTKENAEPSVSTSAPGSAPQVEPAAVEGDGERSGETPTRFEPDEIAAQLKKWKAGELKSKFDLLQTRLEKVAPGYAGKPEESSGFKTTINPRTEKLEIWHDPEALAHSMGVVQRNWRKHGKEWDEAREFAMRWLKRATEEELSHSGQKVFERGGPQHAKTYTDLYNKFWLSHVPRYVREAVQAMRGHAGESKAQLAAELERMTMQYREHGEITEALSGNPKDWENFKKIEHFLASQQPNDMEDNLARVMTLIAEHREPESKSVTQEDTEESAIPGVKKDRGPPEQSTSSELEKSNIPSVKPAKPAGAKRTFKRKIPEPITGHDLIESVLSDIGKITHPETARRDALRQEGKTVFNRTTERGGQYDGWMNLPSQLRALVMARIGDTGASDPDEAAQVAFDHGLIRDPSPDTLREELLKAWRTRISQRAQGRIQVAEQKTQAKQHADFVKDSSKPNAGAEKIATDDLNVGDAVDVSGQQLRVIEVDPDSGSVTLEDHSKYGIQEVQGGHFIYGQLEKGENGEWETPKEEPAPLPKLRPGEKGTSDLFQGGDAPFNLMGEKGADTFKLSAEKEQAEKDAAEAKAKQDREQQSLFSAKPVAAFYSQLSKAIDAIPQQIMSVEQARAAVEKGAKKDEIAMSGILTDPLSPLVDQPAGWKITKKQLQDYAIERQAKVQDVTLSQDEPDNSGFAIVWDNIPDGSYPDYYHNALSTGERFDTKEDAQRRADSVSDDEDNAGATPRVVSVSDLDDERQSHPIQKEKPEDETHFSQYQLPGGEPGSYREQFVTWPKETEEQREKLGQNLLDSIRSGKMTEKEAYAHFDSVKGKEWNDGHSQYSDIANPVVRIRRNIRTDTEGNKTLFLEEIQGPSASEQEKMPPEVRKRIYEVGMKRAIREAAAEGANRLGWTTGTQQAERYSLENQISSIHAGKLDSGPNAGKYIVSAETTDGRKLPAQTLTESELEANVGKDLARKIIDEADDQPEGKTYSGVDLKVGGEGLKALYDVTLPRIANEIAKKFGAKTGTANLRTDEIGGIKSTVEKEGQWIITMHDGAVLKYDTEELTKDEAKSAAIEESQPDRSIHSLPLPEALRDKAMYEGFPLFASKPRKNAYGKKLPEPEFENVGNVRIFHGSSNKFNVFKEDKIDHFGFHFGTEEQASKFGKPRAFVVNIKNALRVSDLGMWHFEAVARALRDRGLLSSEEYEKAWNGNDQSAELRKILLSKGIDGFVYKNELEGNGDSYVAFNPSQISKPEKNSHPRKGDHILYAAKPLATEKKPGAIPGFDSEGNLMAAEEEGLPTLHASNAIIVGPGEIPLNAAKPKGLIAYHGTDKDFKKFSLDKVGTGVGEAVYGYGLFFIDNQADADALRRRLAGRRTGDETKGSTYTVKLGVDKSELLDWDKPIEEQSPNLKYALSRAAYRVDREEAEKVDSKHGNDIDRLCMIVGYDGYSAYSKIAQHFDGSSKKASEYLASIGIPGIMASGPDDRPPSTLYVMFEESSVKITHKNGEPIVIGKGKDGLAAAKPINAQGMTGTSRKMAWSDIGEALRNVMDKSGLTSLIDDIQLTLSPDDRLTKEERERFAKAGDPNAIGDARKTGIFLDGVTAAMDRRKKQWEHALSSARDMVAKLSPALQLELMKRIDEGAPLKAGPFKDAFEEVAKLDAKRVKEAKDWFDSHGQAHWKNYENFLKNMVPHYFQDADQAQKVMDQFLRDKKMMGGTGFLKHRADVTMREIIEWAATKGIKLEPKHTNVIDAIMDRWATQERYFGAHDLIDQMEKAKTGHWEKVDYIPRANERMVNNIIGSRVIDGPDGHRLRQHFFADEPSARIVNNYLGRGLRAGHKWVENYFMAANVLNSAQLGLSFFHGGFVTMEGMVSSFALGIEKILSGDMSGLKDIAKAPFSTISDFKLGGKIRQEMVNPGSAGSYMQNVVNEMVSAGFREGMDSFYKDNHITAFMDAIHGTKVFSGILRAPLALIELVAKPLMEHYVPRMKAAAIYKLAEMHLKENPNLTGMGMRRKLQEDVRSGNNRFGQMTYDNLHLHKTVKDLLMALTRSLGWNWGTFAELGGGFVDWARFAKDAAIYGAKKIGGGGKKPPGGGDGESPAGDDYAPGGVKFPRVTNKMAYTLALPLLVGLFGAVLSAFFSKPPKQLKDYYFVQTGDIDDHGNPVRVVLPSYMKDLFHAFRDPLSTVTNKLHPILSMVAQMLQNKDFYGIEIRHAGEPVMKQILEELKFVGKQVVPFTATNAQKSQSPTLKAAGFLGVTQAPAAAGKTDAQILADSLNVAQIPNKARTQADADHSALRNQIIGLERAGQPSGAELLSKSEAAGKIDPKDVAYINKMSGMTRLQASVSHLSVPDAEKVLEKATPQERMEIAPLIAAKKARQARTMYAGQ